MSELYDSPAQLQAWVRGWREVNRWEEAKARGRPASFSTTLRRSGEHRGFLTRLHGRPPNVTPDARSYERLCTALSHLGPR